MNDSIDLREVQIVYYKEEAQVYAIDYGGAYIDLFHGEPFKGSAAFEALNCWDYEKGRRSEECPFTPQYVKERVETYITSNPDPWWERD